MIDKLTKLLTPKNVLLLVGLLTVLEGAVGYVANDTFVTENFPQIAAGLVIVQNVAIYALRIARLFVPGFKRK